MGTRAQMKAAWADARGEAERMAPILAGALAKDLQAQMTTIPIYPDPPVPGEASELDAILDGEDLTALEKLRDDPNAGISPGGIPRRALAALRIQTLDRHRQKQDLLEQILVKEAPSVITRAAFSKRLLVLGRNTWHEHEAVRQLARKAHNPEGKWFEPAPELGTQIVFVKVGGRYASYLRPGAAPLVATEHKLGLPRWAFSYIFAEKSRWPSLATAPVPLGDGLTLGIYAYGFGDQLEAPIRRQQRWTFLTLGLAAATVLGALAVMQRSLRRERQLNDMKSQFVASVSHELRAPVASIRLMADALEAGKVAPETAKEFHRLIAREGARLSTLVGNVLDHSRIERGLRQWKLEPSDLESLVADTVLLMEPLAKEKNISLETRLAPVEAKVDAGAIQQALVNLLDNAIKFSPADSQVEVSLYEDGPRFQLRVKDEGTGIPKHEHKRIFERFYRPGDELRRETQGSGIGLSLVKSIAEAHDGSVDLESEPGKGSTFILHLPR
ncbi:HAMP domain-containing histidine kinase [Luteolibacter sp. GHJ8]|uniref:histidine kinase n=1 Tax=Luteolibacter rhizosphaerae TaxID=2989719 RepID=A0ABT3G3I0_9BACT|nr:HAMP domain-containing sensor histidine kinase [Luteolibacter rhizosphaerae]MCW1914396.1 HAMP domain-containing histidine kinase [Luteolibacter rhizosphaerae]